MSAKPNKFPENDYLFPPVAESSRLLVGCRREDFSASRIARAVEDCNAHLLNLNVTSFGAREDYDSDNFDTGADPKFPVVFDLRVTHRNPAGISRSLERYGYTVIDSSAGDAPDDITASRIDGLLRYLEI